MSLRKQKQNYRGRFYPQKRTKTPMNKKLFIGMKEKRCLTKKWFPRNRKLMTELNKEQAQVSQTYFKQKNHSFKRYKINSLLNLGNHLLFQIDKFIYTDAIDDYAFTQCISEAIQNTLPDFIMFCVIVGLLFLTIMAKYIYR